LIRIDATLDWTIAGVLVAVAGVVVSVIFGLLPLLKRFRKPEEIDGTLKVDLGTPTVNACYFPHASLLAAVELTNMGTVAVAISDVILSTDLLKDPPVEMYAISSETLLPGERRLVSVYSQSRRYFETHMAALFKIGKESRNPSIRVSFRYQFGQGHRDTKWLVLVGHVNGGALFDLKPP
jgi:hypothetical protein